MSTKTADSDHAAPVPTAPSAMQRWFPIGAWLPQYNWSGFLRADLIAAGSVAALLIPESMGYSAVAGVPVQIGLYDDTGAAAITGLFEYPQRYGVDPSLAGVHSGTHKILWLSGVMDEIGEHRIFDTVRNAVSAAGKTSPSGSATS